jgi:glycosyltransferase involved in cell wall biosynthesis
MKPYDNYMHLRVKFLIAHGHEVYSIYFASKNMGSHSSIDWSGSIALGRSSTLFVKYLNRILFPYQVAQFTKKHDIDIFHVNGMLNSFYFPFSHAKKQVIENQGSDVIITADIYPMFKLFYRFFYRFVDGVIQDSEIAQIKGQKLGAPVKNNEIIEIGVDFRAFNPDVEYGKARKELGLSDGDKMVFSSRGFKDLYNLDVVLRAIPIVNKSVKNTKFVFASHISGFMGKYGTLINQLGIEDHVLFAGQLDHTDSMPYFCKDADVVVSVPSSDSSPSSVYEAMACKTPVILSDLPWHQGKFEKDQDMVVVPVRDVERLAEAIIQIFSGEKTVDVNSAYEKVLKNINYEIENRKLEKLYQRILGLT